MKYLALALLLFTACASSSSTRNIASMDSQNLDRDTAFENFMATVDLDSPSFKLSYKDSGTSVGMKVKFNGEKAGKWVPTNSATNPEAQVVSWYLARFLNMSEQVVPSAYYTAGPKALAEFKTMLDAAKEKNRQRNENKTNILAAISKNPDSMLGVFTAPIENFEIAELVNAGANTINRGHALAGFIRADGATPSTTKKMTFTGLPKVNGSRASETEYELAKEFSRIMILDVLHGQWDRWSGGNVEATFDPTTMRAILIARDNGGASMRGAGHLTKYFGIVTRFDRAQIERVRELKMELDKDSANVAKALHMQSGTKSLTARVDAILSHVEAVVKKHGESKAYFQ